MTSVTIEHARRCVSHHFGCDCREYRFNQSELLLKRAARALLHTCSDEELEQLLGEIFEHLKDDD